MGANRYTRRTSGEENKLMLVVLVGVRGAGKTTLLEKLQGSGLSILQPSTTRKKRSSSDKEYNFVKTWQDDLYAWKIQVGEHTYGMRKSELERDPGKACVTVFEPINLSVFTALRNSLGQESFTVGLDTIDDPTEQHRRVGNDPSRMMDDASFNQARSIVTECDMVLTGDADTVAAALVAAIAVLGRQGAVLTGKDMRPMMAGGTLLVGADHANLRSASYDLRVGKEILFRNQIIELTEKEARFELPAFSYAIVSALEIASLPPFVIGRFDLKVSSFFEGLILSNGPQVDPGYKGALFCLLYNASGRPRTLTLGKHFATIDFTMTTRVAKPYGQKYQLKQKMTQFVTDEAMRGPAPNILQVVDEKVSGVDTRVNGIRNNFWTVAGVVFAIAVAFPVLTIPIAWIEISALHSERQGIEDAEARIKQLLIQARDERIATRNLLANATPAANAKRGKGAGAK
jgi:deoxycytidine triphosphate deaminase